MDKEWYAHLKWWQSKFDVATALVKLVDDLCDETGFKGRGPVNHETSNLFLVEDTQFVAGEINAAGDQPAGKGENRSHFDRVTGGVGEVAAEPLGVCLGLVYPVVVAAMGKVEGLTVIGDFVIALAGGTFALPTGLGLDGIDT